MLSNLLGLTIDKGDLNKSSPSPVVSTLKKTAINYLAIGKMAEDLKLIKLNFSRYLAMEGVKVRGTPDAHFLKDDERTKKFNVLREKYAQSKISAGAKDGTSGNKGWTKILIAGLIGYKFRKKIQRNLTAVILKQYRKQTTIRQLARLKRKIMSKLNALLGKLNLKKIFLEWFKNNSQKIIKPLTEMFTNALKRFLKKGLTKAIARVGIAVASSIWSGPFVPIVAAVIFMGLTLWDPVKEAWRAYTEGEDWVQNFIVNVIDELTFGIFGKENIKNFTDSIAGWFTTLGKKLTEAIDEATKYIKEKVTSFADFLIEKGKSMLVPNDKPENFTSALEELNAKRAQEHNEMVEKYGKYFDEMGEKIEKAKITIAQLKVEIAVLESEIKYLTEGPEKARLEEAKIEKAKEELKLTELQKQQSEQFKGVGDAGDVEKPKAKKTKLAPPPPPPPAPAPVPAPASALTTKPSAPAQTPTKSSVSQPAPVSAQPPKSSTPSKTSGKYEDLKQMVIANEEWKTTVYKDSRGLWTMGVGHLIGDGKKLPVIDPKFPELGVITEKTVLTNDQVRMIFEKDFEEHLNLAQKTPGWDKANEAGKAGLLDLTYNMGGTWYKKFKKAGAFLAEGNFKDAAKELENSLWYKQVKSRAPLTVSLIRSGAANDKEGSAALASVMSSSKVASAGKFVGQESTQIAQAQREQLKPKDVNVADASKTNNVKKTNYQNVAMGDKPDLGTQMANRAT